MEIAALLILLLVIIVWALGSKRSFQDRPEQSSAQDKQEKFPRFNNKNVDPLPSKGVVQGAAYVIDGDTLKIRNIQVRLFGIDAPELDHPYGKNAKRALISLCKDCAVRAEITAQDAHGRTVAKCYLEDGRDLSAEMVKLGLAIDWPKFSDGQYRSLEVSGVRKKLWLADARQKGRMHVWEQYSARKDSRTNSS